MKYWLYKDEQLEIVQESPTRLFLWTSIALCSGFLTYLLLKLISTQEVTFAIMSLFFVLPALILFVGLLLTTYFNPAQKKVWVSIWTLEPLPSCTPPLSLQLEEQNIQIPFHSYIREKYFRYTYPHLISLAIKTPIQLKLGPKIASFTVTDKDPEKNSIPLPNGIILIVKDLTLLNG
ncbi:MAG: hypothetical protein ACFFBD_10945 [Candidatus Hodarchaeota archaeon]